jgi:hypothetical protein
MNEIESEAISQIKAAIEREDLDSIREVLDSLESADNPNIVKVEFTVSDMRFLEKVRLDIKQPDLPGVIRLMLANFKPGYLEAQKKAREAAKA